MLKPRHLPGCQVFCVLMNLLAPNFNRLLRKKSYTKSITNDLNRFSHSSTRSFLNVGLTVVKGKNAAEGLWGKQQTIGSWAQTVFLLF